MATIHPYKGYLNTEFHIHAKGCLDISYSIFSIRNVGPKPILSGTVSPNIPCTINLKVPGNYRIEFNDGTYSEIIVEDGYKFGGSEYKKSFIFDETPWCFIIMNDRTYFYNRVSGESYVETISPDSIEEVSTDYVIFINSNHSERTIFSLVDQKPILNISDIVFYNKEVVIWKEDDIVVIYSLTKREIVSRIKPLQYFIDKDHNQFLFAENRSIYTLELSNGYHARHIYSWKNEFKGFVNNQISIYSNLQKDTSYLNVINHWSGELLKELPLRGVISSVNGFITIDKEKRSSIISKFDPSQLQIPEASLEAIYHDFVFYPCEWDIYYIERTTVFKKHLSNFNNTNEIVLHSINTNLHQTFKQFDNQFVSTDNRFLLFNDNESFVCSKNYSASGYNGEGHIRIHDNIVIMDKDNCISTLSRNGNWDNRVVGNFCFDDFEKFGVVYNSNTKEYFHLGLNIKAFSRSIGFAPYYLIDHMNIGDAIILDGGKVYRHKQECPIDMRAVSSVSPNMQSGIIVDKNNGKVFLLSFDSGEKVSKEILNDLYDNSKYRQVLMDENGTKILFRDSSTAFIKDIMTEEVIRFDNLSYIQQINGIRPTFKQSSSLLPRIVNPITGQILDAELMKTINFISPDGKYYAGTEKDMYEEYFYLDSGVSISDKDFNVLLQSFKYPSNEKKGTNEWETVTRRRVLFVKEHFEFINEKYPNLTNGCNDEHLWAYYLIDVDNMMDAFAFIHRVIDIRGIAIIKKMENNSVVAKIELGKPLKYINYVSFSYDSRYLCLVGYRNLSHGLFLIYDLMEKKLLCRKNTSRAVWTTAFSSSNFIAAYTSTPDTIFFKDGFECDSEKEFNDHLIRSRNFLTFSPDSSLMALSNQGYISKFDIHGVERSDWGHQPSTFVEVRTIKKFEESALVFHDLAACGIEDTNKSKSVSSVSFSNDNKRLMMVGNDGVVIIRNLHLEEDAD